MAVVESVSDVKCLNQWSGDLWRLYNGDCCEIAAGLPDNSLDFCIHSPPFSSLYIYSDSECDMGNSKGDAEFFNHYGFLIPELLRVTVPGRLCAVHCKDLPKYRNRDEASGLTDFPGLIIRAFEECGRDTGGCFWAYHSRVTIWKCPVTERERTNNNGLLHKTVLRDRSQVRQGMADYLLLFRKTKPGDESNLSDKPINEKNGFAYYVGDGDNDPRVTNDHPSKYARKAKSSMMTSVRIWQRYAEPVWWDIDQTDVLNYRPARGVNDERHICPLQLGVIERSVQIWTLPDEVVLSPFAGIGSEGVGAIRQGRRFVGIELKPEYCEWAKSNLAAAEESALAKRLFA